MLNLTLTDVERIVSFIGYGNPSAPVWFIGLEEGVSKMDDADIAANLAARGRFKEVMDLAKAHLSLVEGSRPYDVSTRQSFTSVWLWMARFARAIEGASDWREIERAKHYIRKRLGRSNGQTFLTYAAPIPEKGLHTREWTTMLRRTGIEIEALLERRRGRIRQMVERHRPSIVICHGNSATNEYKSLLPCGSWHFVGKNRSFQVSQDPHGSRFYIVPFFGNGQMSFARADEILNLIRQLNLVAASDGSNRNHVRPVHTVAIINAPPRTNVKIDCMPTWKIKAMIDPKETIRLLDQLVGLGFTDEAFWRLHHKQEVGKKETISNMRGYCETTITKFRKDGTNQRVHERLLLVLQTCRECPTGGTADFVALAEQAYKQIR